MFDESSDSLFHILILIVSELLYNATFVGITQILNHILTSQHGKRIAVIENEVLNSKLSVA